MPVLPILYLPAAVWASESRRRVAVIAGALLVEAVAVAPLWMSATNTWWLGPYNPTRFALSTGNNEYMQNFIALEAAARARGIERLHVLYPPLSAKRIEAYVPQAEVIVDPAASLEPGWYAVNVRVEQYLPALLHGDPRVIHGYRSLRDLAARWEPVWQTVARGKDFGYVAGTFHLYRLDGEISPR
jgi:hypothetical protein